MLGARDMLDCIFIGQGTLLKWEEPRVLYRVHCGIAQDFHKGLMVRCDHQVVASQHKHAAFLQSICNRERLTLDGRISWLRWGGEPGPCQDKAPAILTADGCIGEATTAMLLQKDETQAFLRPVCGEASRAVRLKVADAFLHHLDNSLLAVLEGTVKWTVPIPLAWFKELPEGLHCRWVSYAEGYLIYKAKPRSCISDIGGFGEGGDGLQQIRGGPYSIWSQGEPSKVDLLSGELELRWVEDDPFRGT